MFFYWMITEFKTTITPTTHQNKGPKGLIILKFISIQFFYLKFWIFGWKVLILQPNILYPQLAYVYTKQSDIHTKQAYIHTQTANVETTKVRKQL